MKNPAGIVVLLLISLILCASSVTAQEYSHNVKHISVFKNDAHQQEVRIKNNKTRAETFIIYRADKGDMYWQEIGSVTIFANTEGKFFVKEGFNYAYGLEDKRPRRLALQGKRKWEVHDD